MGIVKGLDAIRKSGEERGGGNFTTNFYEKLRVPANKSLPIIFAQELDESAPGYDSDAGVGFLAVEHQNPEAKKWWQRFVCTSEEGACWGCESGLKQKYRLYINVLVLGGAMELNDDEEFPVIRVLEQGYGPGTIVEWLLDYAGDAGTIMGAKFKIKRSGSGQYDTSYTLVPGAPVGDDDPDPTEFDLYNLDEDVVNHVPYEAQASFFGMGSTSEDTSEDEASDDDEGEDYW